MTIPTTTEPRSIEEQAAELLPKLSADRSAALDLFRVARLYAQGRCSNTARRLLRSALVLLGRHDGNVLDALLDHRHYAAPVLSTEVAR